MKREKMKVTQRTNRLWSAGIAAVMLLAAATTASAQGLTLQLARPMEVPLIHFNHTSTVRGENGVLTVHADATHVVLNIGGIGNYIFRVLEERPKNADGSCPTIDGVPYHDLRGNGVCQRVESATNSIAWGSLNMNVVIDTSASPDGGTSLPGVASPDACGIVNGGNNFCIVGEVLTCASGAQFCDGPDASSPYGPSSGPSGILLRGRIRTVQDLGVQTSMALYHDYNWGTPGYEHTDMFEYVLEATGGTLFDAGAYQSSGTDPTQLFVVQFEGLRDISPAPLVLPAGSMFADWTQPFTEVIVGIAARTNYGTAMLGCTAQIKGKVTSYFSPSSGVPGSEVSIAGQPNIVPGPDGSYASTPTLCSGSHVVTVLPPSGTAVVGAGSQTVNVPTGSSVVTGINFSLVDSPLNTSAFTTFTQAAWGTKPKGNNAGQLLNTYFNFLYPTGELEIGIPDTVGRYSITATGPAAILAFLPQEGLGRPLTASYVDPPSKFKVKHWKKLLNHKRLGGLAGEMMALELNVRFSALYLTRSGLGARRLASGKLQGWTVDEVLTLGNRMLGGDPVPAILQVFPAKLNLLNYELLEQIIAKINRNYQAGTTDQGYLLP
jgi:hypothetical protein